MTDTFDHYNDNKNKNLLLSNVSKETKNSNNLLQTNNINNDYEPYSRSNSYMKRVITKMVEFEGVGLHTGANCKIKIYPSNESGFSFIRTDIQKNLKKDIRKITGNWKNVIAKQMCTGISNEHGVSILTIEHLLASMSGLNIFDAIIEVDGPEIPILDGSSLEFLNGFGSCVLGLKNNTCSTIKIIKPIHFYQKISSSRFSCVSFFPSNERKITVFFDGFNKMKKLLEKKEITVDFNNFEEVSFARTFGFLSDAQKLQEAGFAKGASFENTVVINDDSVINESGLRSNDEILKHKVLDVFGDLSLAGAQIEGHFVGINPSHFTNNQLIKKIFDSKGCWKYKMPYESNYNDKDVYRTN